MTRQHVPHGTEELCEAGTALYARALREGRIPSGDAEPAPCLVDFGLLHPELDDLRWLRPTAPHVALSRLLRTIEDRVVAHRQREEMLTAAFRPLLAIDDRHHAPLSDDPGITVLSGAERIRAAVADAMEEAVDALLAIQPHGSRPPETLATIQRQNLRLLARDCRMRTLCQQVDDPSRGPLLDLRQLEGDVEVRTLDEVTEHLLVVDRTVAFIPMGRDHGHVLELRNPALVEYFATTFWRLWRLAAPLWPQAAPQPTENGVTTRQHAIAALLVEGLTDAEIAGRLGMNIRTARVHIAKLAAVLGSNSRAQLGYLIGRSGILGQVE
ncbi:helix-turn-helix transcriptional regulator [Streptomyces sp. NPDC005562]|uniref:helix-turn-helix transcriptional regulator n=1 Tax=Streptomyces sp. NPDC005562 TaxID=3154890 RepID=UPI0033AF7231